MMGSGLDRGGGEVRLISGAMSALALFAAGFAVLLPSSSHGAGQSKPGLAVMKLEAGEGVSERTTGVLEELLLSQIQETGLFGDVIGYRDISAMLSLEEQRQKLTGCSDDQCMAELGGALGVSYVASAVVGRLGEKFVLSLKLMDVKSAKVVGRASKVTGSDEEKLIAAMKDAVSEAVVAAMAGGPYKRSRDMVHVPAGWFWMGCGKPVRPAPGTATGTMEAGGFHRSLGPGTSASVMFWLFVALAAAFTAGTCLSVKLVPARPIRACAAACLAAASLAAACGAVKHRAKYAEACRKNERPGHWVYLDDYYIDRHEVTVAEYRACVESEACVEPLSATERNGCNWGVKGRENHPVNCVTWQDAQAYCYWSSKRLPTEAEWEKAARGVSGSIFPWGDRPGDCSMAVMSQGRRGCGRDATWAVCRKERGNSPYGACDMAGNVWEWVQDWYSRFRPTSVHEPKGPAKGREKVLKGGAWASGPMGVRASVRMASVPLRQDRSIGFRCAADAQPSRGSK